MRLVKRLFDIVGINRRLNSLGVSKNIKNKIIKTYLWNLPKRGNQRHRVANIVGYRVNNLNPKSFYGLFKDIFINQCYYFLTDNQRPLIIDCGANIGMSIFYFKTLYPNSGIIAFEPDKETFSCLKANILDNKLTDVNIFRKAVSDREGESEFYYDQDKPGSLTMSTIWQRKPKQTQIVEATLLSRYIDKEVDFLKMDVEGAELSIIEELSSKGKLSYIKQMVIEYHHHIVREDDLFSRLLKILEDSQFGYQIEAKMRRPLKGGIFQDILIYAYQKSYPFLHRLTSD